MVTNNKVLTVSYGTFSCTLEGFDDSFETMKAIAEYFRDLASDDRYFGAEPATPDADMMARIAEREIARNVRARTESGSIYLSADAQSGPAQDGSASGTNHRAAPANPTASDAAIPEKQPEQDTAPVDQSPPEDAPTEEREIEDVTDQILATVATEAVTTAEDTQDGTEDTGADMVQDTLTDAEEDTFVAGLAPDLEGDLEVYDFDEHEVAQDDIEDASVVDDASDDEDDDMLRAISAQVSQEADAETAPQDAAPEIIDAPEVLETPEILDAPEVVEAEEVDKDDLRPAQEDSIAAKLQRIRAVVSKSREEPEDDDFSEDEHADNFLANTVRDIESVLKLDDEMAAAALVGDTAETETDETETAETLTDEADEAPRPVAPVRPVRARVVRMKKADFEEAISAGLLEAEPDDDDDDVTEEATDEATDEATAAPADDLPQTSLTPEDEAELLAELAQVEAELNRSDVPQAAETPAETETPSEPIAVTRPTRGKHLTEVAAKADTDVSRLIAETDTQMREPEGSRRRQAIAQLRAAVAATKAEQKAGSSFGPDHDEAEIYRDDLASVVRPVEASDIPAHRPRAGEAAPLKLVAEQRVDKPAPAAKPAPDTAERGPVRPRRVSAADRKETVAADDLAAPVGAEPPASLPSGAHSFAEFAETVGATKLPDVLEAAAAYLTFVEGQEKFSRPMVMRMARDVDQENYSREDSLRTFGQLLRENKIEKIEGGRFTASDLIDFKPEDRAAG